MRFLKRLAYNLGLVLGVFAVAAAGALVLIYLFTGKLISVRTGESGTRIVLENPDALAALIRQRAGKPRHADSSMELTLGEDDGKA